MSEDTSDYQSLAFQHTCYIEQIHCPYDDLEDPLLPPRKPQIDSFKFQTLPKDYISAFTKLMGSLRVLNHRELIGEGIRLSDVYQAQIEASFSGQTPPLPKTNPHFFREDLFEVVGEFFNGQVMYASIHGFITTAIPQKKYDQSAITRGQINLRLEELRHPAENSVKKTLDECIKPYRQPFTHLQIPERSER